MGFLGRLLLGNGQLKPGLRAALEAEGLVALEEGLPGSIRYRNFKAPGKRFHGKVTTERLGVGISEARLAVYCRSGRVKLIDTAFSEPRLRAVEVSLHDPETMSILIEFTRAEVPKVSGEITIRASTPKAAHLVDQLNARMNRSG